MKVEIKAWGNSKAIRIPKDVLFKYGLNEGDSFELDTDSTQLILTPLKKEQTTRKSLRQLLAETDNQLPILEDWENMPPVGEELL